MPIISIYTDTAGQIFVNPRRVKIITSDNLATVTTAGYLNNAALEGYTILNTDIIDMWYGAVGTPFQITSPGTYDVFIPSISNGVITLVPDVNAGNVLLPVVANHFATFNNTAGQIKDSGLLPSSLVGQLYAVTSPGSLTAGNFPQLNDANGTLKTGLPPSATGQAFVAVSPGSLTTGHLLKTNDVNGTLADSGIVATNVVQNTVTANTQNIAGNLTLNSNPVVVCKVVTATFAQLAAAARVAVFNPATLTAQIAILDIKVMLSTGLSGGGGDRLLSLTDGTLVFNDTGITAALLGTPIFTLWGGTGNPIASAAEATISTAGAGVYLQYIGGTLDYTAGDVTVAVTYAQVTT